MERLAGAHAGIDSVGLGVGGGVPALLDVGRGRVESVVALVVEGHCLERPRRLLDVGA